MTSAVWGGTKRQQAVKYSTGFMDQMDALVAPEARKSGNVGARRLRESPEGLDCPELPKALMRSPGQGLQLGGGTAFTAKR